MKIQGTFSALGKRQSGQSGDKAAKKSAKRPAPVSLRLDDQQRKTLAERAGSLPLTTYIKHVLFSGKAPVFRKSPKTVSVDRELAARLLGLLGQSRLASNLNQLAKAVNHGSLPVNETTEADLQRACEEISEMRKLLLLALGVLNGEGDDDAPRLSQTFQHHAGGRP